eukprot:516208-Prorocentrum_minimum.AAC.3
MPALFSPQHLLCPLVKRAHECLMPRATVMDKTPVPKSVTAKLSPISDGTFPMSSVEPIPSLPEALSPQHFTWPYMYGVHSLKVDAIFQQIPVEHLLFYLAGVQHRTRVIVAGGDPGDGPTSADVNRGKIVTHLVTCIPGPGRAADPELAAPIIAPALDQRVIHHHARML